MTYEVRQQYPRVFVTQEGVERVAERMAGGASLCQLLFCYSTLIVITCNAIIAITTATTLDRYHLHPNHHDRNFL